MDPTGQTDCQFASLIRVLPSDAAAGDFFGRSVSISGDYSIVGAMGDDDNGSYSGSAYIFTRDGISWIQQTKLTASDGAASDRFGEFLSISGDSGVFDWVRGLTSLEVNCWDVGAEARRTWRRSW